MCEISHFLTFHFVVYCKHQRCIAVMKSDLELPNVKAKRNFRATTLVSLNIIYFPPHTPVVSILIFLFLNVCIRPFPLPLLVLVLPPGCVLLLSLKGEACERCFLIKFFFCLLSFLSLSLLQPTRSGGRLSLRQQQ